MKHKWHDEIVAWAKGCQIEYFSAGYGWQVTNNPEWCEESEYRIKPQPKQKKFLYVIMYDGHLNSVRLSQYSRLGEDEFIFGKIEVQDD